MASQVILNDGESDFGAMCQHGLVDDLPSCTISWGIIPIDFEGELYARISVVLNATVKCQSIKALLRQYFSR